MDCTASPHLDSGHIDLEQEAEPLALLQLRLVADARHAPRHLQTYIFLPQILIMTINSLRNSPTPEHEHVDLGGNSAQV